MQRLLFEQDFGLPVDQLYAHLAEHEHLEELFAPIRITRLNDGTDGTRNGVGSARKMQLGPTSFVETVTEAVPDERIVYRITEGSPLTDHEGVMTFSARPDGGSHLRYTIEFGSKLPGIDLVVAGALKRSVTAGLRKLGASSEA